MIIPKNKHLGKLCKRGHDFEGTRRSLRNISRTCIECQKLYAKTHTLRIQRYSKLYNASQYGKIKDKRQKTKITVGLLDPYVKQCISKNTKLKFSSIPQDLVEVKRLYLKIYRFIRDGGVENG